MLTREEWLRKAVELIDSEIFEGDLDTINHQFQINCGICPGKKLTNTIQPYDGEDVRLDDFFPTTISVNHTISDPMILMENLTRECIFAFFNLKKIDKLTKSMLNKYYFEEPYSSCCPSEYLRTLLKSVYRQMVEKYGEFPGIAVKTRVKEKKEGKKNTLIMFCPECGYEIKVTRKMHEKHGQGTPTCVCGAKMGLDCSDEIQNDQS